MGWHTIRRASDILEVSENTVRNRIKGCTIPYRQVQRGGRHIYEVEISDVASTREATPEMMDARESIASLKARVEGLEAQLEHARDDREGVEAVLQARSKELGTAREAIAVLEAIIRELREQVDRERADVRGAGERVTELIVQIDIQARDMDEVQKRAEEHLRAYEALRQHNLGGGLTGRVRRAFRALIGQTVPDSPPRD